MTRNRMGMSAQMAAIADLIKNDILSTPDEEILAESIEDGIDPGKKATELRESALAKIRSSKRERLAKARVIYDQTGSISKAVKPRPSIEEIKKLVQSLIQNGTANGLALAFRKGEKLSDSDWEGLWDDMTEMGLIDDGKHRA